MLQMIRINSQTTVYYISVRSVLHSTFNRNDIHYSCKTILQSCRHETAAARSSSNTMEQCLLPNELFSAIDGQSYRVPHTTSSSTPPAAFFSYSFCHLMIPHDREGYVAETDQARQPPGGYKKNRRAPVTYHALLFTGDYNNQDQRST